MSLWGPPRRSLAKWRCKTLSLIATVGALAGVLAGLLATFGTANPANAAAALVSLTRYEGATRYETAVDVARRFVSFRESEDASLEVDSVVLTSGEESQFGYALAAPPLSRKLDAALLITPPAELHVAVTQFLADHDIAKVTIIGGPAVVSPGVEAELRAKGYDVDRISGGDAYATAVSVAEQVGPTTGSPGTYGSRGRTVLLATGENFADALALGPLAYQGQHPVLLTPRNELHAEVSDFLRSANVDHTIIAGGKAAVSSDVEDAIKDLGVTVQRLAGDDRYKTATAIAQELHSSSAPSCFDGSGVGLAYGRRSPDAIVSGPLLGARCAPLLLTDIDRLDRATRSFLEHDNYLSGDDDDGRLRMMVFGGEAAVSDNTASAARSAATLKRIGAKLSGIEGRCTFVVTFDEPVLTDYAENGRSYRKNGSSLSDATVDAGSGDTTRRAVVTLPGARGGVNVPIVCSDPLDAGDEIQVAGGVIRAADGERVVGRSSAKVASDNRAPSVTVTAFVGGSKVWVDTNEVAALHRSDVRFTRDLAGTTNDLSAIAQLGHSDLDTVFEVDVPDGFGTLKSGDVVTVVAGALEDLAGNESPEVVTRPTTDKSKPRVSRVTVTSPEAVASASLTFDGDNDGSIVSDAVEITAKTDGGAAGARGNDWTFEIKVESAWVASRRSSVTVNSGSSAVVLRASHERTLNDIVADLNQHGGFSSRFDAKITANTPGSTATLRRDSGPDSFSEGASLNRLRVEWTESVIGCAATVGGVNRALVAVDSDGDGDADYKLDGTVFDGKVEFVDAPDNADVDTFGSAACDTEPSVKPGTLVAWLQSEDYDALPSSRSRLIITEGAAEDRAGNEAEDHVYRGFSRG